MVDQMEFAAANHRRGIENHQQHHPGHNHHHHHHHHHQQQQQQQPQFNDDHTTSYIHSQSHPLRGDSLRHHLARHDHHHYDQLLGVANNIVGAAQPNGSDILNHLYQQRQQLLPSPHLESANQHHLQHHHNITINNSTPNNSTTTSTNILPTCQQSSQNQQQQQLLNTTANSTTSSDGNSTSGGTDINHHSHSQRSNGKKWSKRIRTTFTPEQLKQLEDEFSRQMYLVGEYRQFLAKSLGLSEGQVKVWFQNRRIKHRKLNK